MERVITERGMLALNELADSIDFWAQEAVLSRLGIDSIEALREPWNPVKLTEAEDILLDIGQDVYDAIAGLP